MSEVKIFRVEGYMLISHDRFPTWQRFSKEVRGLTKEEALEKVYSILGSHHKLKRYHIKVTRIEEISPEEARSPVVKHLSELTRIVVK